MKVYEVGTYEQYEEGFHSFYRTLDKGKAIFVLNEAKKYKAMIPELALDATDLEVEKYIALCDSLDQLFKEVSGVDFCLSSCSSYLYEIQIRESDLS
ncbi:hypothetical protein N5B96_05465 [Acinetobacter johnsonii]|uniref:Uncharacterized protein n=1 Tax=Acinetobacter johnsonii TaxID=40214 RepID=A0AA42IH04_ACIJO|nr:hypothetical protein [Acinetobacter johnsonii]MDH0657738.1 hypothetical protein [Acinetobacter johnsonii]MDH1068941.1 hypothetical protein [Acinetobacter johnsonii]